MSDRKIEYLIIRLLKYTINSHNDHLGNIIASGSSKFFNVSGHFWAFPKIIAK